MRVDAVLRSLTLALVAASLCWPVLAAPSISGSSLPSGSSGDFLRHDGTAWDNSTIGVTDLPAAAVKTTGSYSDPAWITDLAKSKVGLSLVENTALSTWAGTTNVTTVGALTAGSIATGFGNIQTAGTLQTGAATVSSLVSSGAVSGTLLTVNPGGSIAHAADRIMLEATMGWAELRLDGPDATTKGGFEIASYEADGGNVAAVFQISAAGINRMPVYGAGTATFDASGNISSVSDERVKHIRGAYTPGLEAVRKIKPIVYNWRPESHMETAGTYAGFSAQNVRAALGDLAVGHNKDGMLSLQDRVILAAAVTAIDELASKSSEPKELLRKAPDGTYSGPIVDEIRKPLVTRILSLEARLEVLEGKAPAPTPKPTAKPKPAPKKPAPKKKKAP